MSQGKTVSELARRTGGTPSATRERLRRLERYGLARQAGSEWYGVERDLDEVAAELGTWGKLTARKLAYKTEQNRFERRRQSLEREKPGSKLVSICESTGNRTGSPKLDRPLPLSETNLEAALRYAALGFPVLPLQSIRDGGCTCRKTCGRAGKHPIGALVSNGVKDATTEPATIRKWFTRVPDANVGIATGKMVNGHHLVVLDIDPRNNGYQTFMDLIADRVLPKTAMAKTGGGGHHLFFKSSKEIPCGSMGSGIDLKGAGGYVVASPSIHLSGSRYEWTQLLEKITPLPDWLEGLILREKKVDVPLDLVSSRRS
ncbi:MAG TPA: bifunctional DNA primase/polymerase [Candidatus Binataceae bacterium]|nr:bifunctional DNA primase/polymerase [Candidatus Binataceae bacterium]